MKLHYYNSNYIKISNNNSFFLAVVGIAKLNASIICIKKNYCHEKKKNSESIVKLLKKCQIVKGTLVYEIAYNVYSACLKKTLYIFYSACLYKTLYIVYSACLIKTLYIVYSACLSKNCIYCLQCMPQ